MDGALASYGQGVLKSTLGRLGSFLWSEALLISGVKRDVQFIRDELLTMDAFLQDIHSKSLNQQERVWMLQVLEVAYEAENCIEEFTQRLATTSRPGFIADVWRVLHFIRTLYTRYSIAKTIQGLKQRAEEVSNRRSRYNSSIVHQGQAEMREVPNEVNPFLTRYNHQVEEDALIGVHTNIEQIQKFVQSTAPHQNQCTVISIIGPSGSGKTALAKMAYRRRKQFFDRNPVAAWVTCPKESNLELILKDILRQFKKHPEIGDDQEQLLHALKTEFSNNKFIRNTDVDNLPKKIRKLKLLETLDIRQTGIQQVPKSIVKLRNLKHLLAGHFSKPESTNENDSHFSQAVEVPEGLDALSALQTLAHVNATRDSELFHVVREMTQLKKLGVVIHEDLNLRALCISLVMLSASLRSLSVCNKHAGGSLEFLEYLCFPPLQLESLNLLGHLWKLPQWITSHRNLTKITLSKTYFRNEAIKSLGKIQSLLCLRLYSKSFIDHVFVLGTNEFPKLKVLVIYCHDIRIVHFDNQTAPMLEVFKWFLRPGSKTDSKLVGLTNLSLLKQVSIRGTINSDLQVEIMNAVNGRRQGDTPLVFEEI